MFGLFRSSTPVSSAGRTRRPLGVESLEERSVPAVFIVTNLSDHNPGSLRQAIQNANARAGEDTIRFAPLLSGTIVLTTGQLPVADDLKICGPGADVLAVSGNHASRLFELDGGLGIISVKMKRLRLTGGNAAGADVDGGALYVGANNLTVKGCVISGNRAEDDGGAVAVTGGRLKAVNTIFANNAALSDDGGAVDLDEESELVARNCQFISNRADDSGGALYLEDTQASLTRCVISGNTAGHSGGGFYFDGGCRVSVESSTISQNTAQHGGGINGFSGGRLTVRNSTISGNRSNGDPNAAGENYGGAGALLYNVQTLIVNSTISGNVDQSGTPNANYGGGGLNLYGGNTIIRNSTIAFNSTVGRGGGILLRESQAGSGTLHVTSTIISNSTAPGGNFDVARPGGQGNVTFIRSLVQRIQPGFINTLSRGNILGANPLLLPLADNGGPTMTHSFAVGSPARDAGSNPEQLQFDQRGVGFPRVKNGAVDIGALEL